MANSKRTHNVNNTINIDDFRGKILKWYDKHQRILPWRATKKQKPNPYYVWLSEIMLQQTTVVTVGPYFEKFIKKWPTVHDLAAVDKEEVMHEWAGLGYYARARNLHKCAQAVSKELKGVFPEAQDELEQLSGIGNYTSAAVRAIAFNKPANVVDGNIERVMARIYAVTKPLPESKSYLKKLAAGLADNRKDRPGDYAQALMDLGAGICTPRSPRCSLCPVNDICAGYKKGVAETLPVRKSKKPKPQKHGAVYWIINNKDEVCFGRRSEKEMLGGMIGLPTSEWIVQDNKIKPLKGYKRTEQFITHSFTHFDLKLHIYTKNHNNGTSLPQNNPIWVSPLELDSVGLPTLFKKVVKLMK